MFKSIFKIGAIAAAAIAIVGCSRVETGSVGIRIDMSKQVQSGELLPGSWNQTVIGDILMFPVKDITVTLENKTPMTADNSALADFDVTVVYNISPTAVAELYSTKSKSFHATDKDGDVFLMYNYVMTLVNNASYKVVRKYSNLQVADNREKIEQEIREIVSEQLREEKLDTSINLNVVQVRNVLPNATVLESATALVKSQNDLKIKENEVKSAELEAKRMSALSANSAQSIAYMQATAELNYSEAAKAGKIHTIIVPRDFKGMVNVGK